MSNYDRKRRSTGFVKIHASKVIDGCKCFYNWYQNHKAKELEKLIEEKMAESRDLFFGLIKRPNYTREQAIEILKEDDFLWKILQPGFKGDLLEEIEYLYNVASEALTGWCDPIMEINIYIAGQLISYPKDSTVEN